MRVALSAVLLSFVMASAACTSPVNENERANANRAGAKESANSNANVSTARQGSPVSDAWLIAKVKLALLADTRVSGFATDVDAAGGAVTLSGKVDTDEAKAASDEVVRKIDGVNAVNNHLQVVPEAKRKEVDASDDKIYDAIEKAMNTDPVLQDAGLVAETNAGVVTLSGSTDTHEQLIKAAQSIRKIPGVKSVITTGVTVMDEAK